MRADQHGHSMETELRDILWTSGDVSLCVPSHEGYDTGCGLEGGHNAPAGGLPSGRMSLFDMMNFSLQGFVVALMALSQEVRAATRHPGEDIISDEDKERALGQPKIHCPSVQNFSAKRRRASQRCFLILDNITKPAYRAVAEELVTLNEAIGDDIKTEYFYRYPRPKALLAHIQIAEWLPIYDAFPSSRPEIESGLDCYALRRPTACIFHMMRAAELGMRAVARERKVTFPNHPLEWAEWQNVIDGIEKSGKTVMATMGRGAARDAASTFYTNAVAQLRALKETRNRIMHMRGPPFDDLDAQRTMNQVRDLMTGLARKIDEKTRRPIRRWP